MWRKGFQLLEKPRKSFQHEFNRSYDEVAQQNSRILVKLMTISQRKPVYNYNVGKTGSKASINRNIKLKNIEEENIKIGARLIALPSTYHRNRMQKQIKEYNELKKRLRKNKRSPFYLGPINQPKPKKLPKLLNDNSRYRTQQNESSNRVAVTQRVKTDNVHNQMSYDDKNAILINKEELIKQQVKDNQIQQKHHPSNLKLNLGQTLEKQSKQAKYEQIQNKLSGSSQKQQENKRQQQQSLKSQKVQKENNSQQQEIKFNFQNL